MTEKYENAVVKDKKKARKRSKNPRNALDFFTNFMVDYKNAVRHIKNLQKELEKVEWELYQMEDAAKQITLFVKHMKLEKKDIIKSLQHEVSDKDEIIKEDKESSG